MNSQQKYLNPSRVLINIEQFVERTITSRYAWREFHDELIDLVLDLHAIFDFGLQYSTYVEAMSELMWRNTLDGEVNIVQINDLSFIQVQQGFDHFTQDRDKELKAFHRLESHNRARLKDYLGDLISHYGKLLFIRVDLAYLKDKQHKVNVWQFQHNVRELLGFIQDGDRCFRDLEGYAWALEQGEEKGFHCHLLLIYNGSTRQKDYYLADQTIQRWQEISEGDGYGFNCNTPEHKNQFRKMDSLGIGMIHRDNDREVQNAINACSYLVNPEKSHQQLRVKLPRMHTFGKGSYKRSYRRYR
ncbi:inovirus Gp2 family protein [Acinetobacter ursingii]|uniref:YagK/YfjJ domain-containing protein n=1 Tax=Acinetobacter ursingii TaxID=108980 RepID=UPI002448532F|nr:inovirus-type Gp2 protein [Acinetobacter ursingii]MDG9861468.1 inovirus Gp2 family protein [Acinetobacter ursingii]MDG9895144.1 inovirus Gp2 family protein [Acinetobacter ursingii]MDH0008706.1 inovirus Gp2 family protein [Acinetobacter ursingii]MDH0480416.1 inovirus Gp2 family protein [Acinetobacter ursingii]MDH2121076.1 inovirus Gp2 family protein [Acinetobacter ursingii]